MESMALDRHPWKSYAGKGKQDNKKKVGEGG